jgi:hypothetical protein
MDDATYRALFEDYAYYCTPDGTLLQATWIGYKLSNTTNWILAPAELRNPYIEHWHYEVDRNGTVIARYYAGRTNDQNSKTRLQETGVTDLTIDDFTKVE